MINFFRSFLDEITLEALKINLIFWILLWFSVKAAYVSKFRDKIKKIESIYLKDIYLIVLFLISFFVIRYYIKINFIEKFLNIGPN